MLKEHKNPGILVAEIKMSRTSNDCSFLLVEGKSDSIFWRLRVSDACEIVDSEGKQNVLGCIKQLDAQGFRGALGIVDSDFDRLNGNSFESKNLVTTDAHDLESLLCRCSPLSHVLVEYGNDEKIKKFEHKAGHDVRTALLNRALVFGKLR
ncbi:MAG: DUF4435 domain-containing protein [Aestuariivita sp.]|nr:DUF4435 domain-containing protein [Aestuariivita sp.]